MLGLITVLVVMVVSAECTGETDDTRTTRYERHRDLGGLFFSKNLILETSARSRVECATRCQVRQGCAAFTFSPVWGTCRQHKCFSTSLSPSYNSPGAETSSRKCLASDLENLARGKPTQQSSTVHFLPRHTSYSHQAVDGNLDSNMNHGSCTHTGGQDNGPWWQVDLMTTVEVHAVTITNRGDCCGDRLSDFDVHIINSAGEETLCYHYTGPMRQGATETLYCPEPVVGRYVRIRKPAGVLSLCEVQVLGPN